MCGMALFTQTDAGPAPCTREVRALPLAMSPACVSERGENDLDVTLTSAEVKGWLQAGTEESLAAGALEHIAFHCDPAVSGADEWGQLGGLPCPFQRVLALRKTMCMKTKHN